jgi:hypothetical protein
VMFAYQDKIAGGAKELASRDISFHRKAVIALAVFLVIVWFFPHPHHVQAWALRTTTFATVLTAIAL